MVQVRLDRVQETAGHLIIKPCVRHRSSRAAAGGDVVETREDIQKARTVDIIFCQVYQDSYSETFWSQYLALYEHEHV